MATIQDNLKKKYNMKKSIEISFMIKILNNLKYFYFLLDIKFNSVT